MKTTTLIRTKERIAASAGEKHDASREALAVMAAPAAIIGLWAVACLVSAMISAGGPLALVKTWFQAVAGI